MSSTDDISSLCALKVGYFNSYRIPIFDCLLAPLQQQPLSQATKDRILLLLCPEKAILPLLQLDSSLLYTIVHIIKDGRSLATAVVVTNYRLNL